MDEEKRRRPPIKKAEPYDIGDNLARILERILINNHKELLGRINDIMSEIDNLRTSVNTLQTTAADGFTAMNLAFTELADDIAGIPANADVATEAGRVAAVATDLGTLTAAFAQRLRDAIPTAPPEEPLPPVEEEIPAPPNPDPNV